MNVQAKYYFKPQTEDKMQVRCTYCSHSFNLSRDYMQGVVANAGKKTTEAVDCTKCRKTIKVQISQMRRYVPTQQSSGGGGGSGNQKGS